MDFSSEPCLLCLSTLIGGGRTIPSFLKSFQNDNNGDEDVCFAFCSECKGLVDAVAQIHDQISQLQTKFKTDIEKVRRKLLESKEKVSEGQTNREMTRMRTSLLDFTDKNGSSMDTTVCAESIQVKIEQMDEAFDFYDDVGPSSPSAFILEPEGNNELEFDDELFVKQEIAVDDQLNTGIAQKRKYQHRIRTDTLRRSTRVKQSLTQDKKPEVIKTQEIVQKRVITKRRKRKPVKSKTVAPKVALIKTLKTKNYQRVFQCKICDMKFNKNVKLIFHLFKKHETDDKPFSCEKCQKKFTLQINLQRHINLHQYEKEKPLVCEVCDTRFAKQAKFDAHVLSHTQVFTCEICGRVLNSKHGHKIHLRIHTGETPFKCDLCEERFSSSTKKRAHFDRVHTNEDYPCNLCPLIFKTDSGLKVHLQRHSGTGVFRRFCSECGETFSSSEARKTHELKMHGLHGDVFVCHICGAKIFTPHGIKRHKELHLGIKNFKCDICQATFSLAQTLKQHLATHSTERPFVCTFCGQSFKLKSLLSDHEKKLHSKDYKRDYKVACPHCPKKFEFKSRLDGHIRQAHTGEKPFGCHVESCSQKFAQKSLLTQHLKSHGIYPEKMVDRAPRTKRDVFASSSSQSSSANRKTTKGQRKAKEDMDEESTSASSEDNSDNGQQILSNSEATIYSLQPTFPSSSPVLQFPNHLYYQHL